MDLSPCQSPTGPVRGGAASAAPAARQKGVTCAMNNSKPGIKAWIMVAFFALFMAIMGFNLLIYSSCAMDTMSVYGIGQAELTTLASTTSGVGLFAGLIFGPLVDRFGARKMILLGLLLGAALFFVRAAVDNYVIALVLTFLASFFVGVCQVAAGKVLDTWFTKDKVSVAFSIQVCAAAFGSVGSFSIGNALGLHNSLLLIAICYAVLFVVWALVGGYGPLLSAQQQAVPPAGGTARVYKSSYVWLLSIGYSCAVGATLLINTYCINAFTDKGLTPEGAAAMGTAINFSMLVGSYLGTFLMSVVKRYNLCTIIFFGGGIVGFLLAWFTPLGINTWIFMIAGAVIMGSNIGICVSRIPLIPLTGQFPQEYVGTASGASEAIKGAITFIFPIVVANIFGNNYNAIFLVFGVVGLIGLVTSGLMVPELGPKGKIQQAFASQSGQAASTPQDAQTTAPAK